MFRICCPFCGEREHSEFAYGGDAAPFPPPNADADEWLTRVFWRDNVRGRQTETWQHIHGCRMWLLIERDTATHEIFSITPADPKLRKFAESGFGDGAKERRW